MPTSEQRYVDATRRLPVDAVQERRFFWGELSLAGAYAETGRFAEAIERAEHAALLAGNSKRNDVSRHLESLASGQAIRSGGLATKQDEASEHGS